MSATNFSLRLSKAFFIAATATFVILFAGCDDSLPTSSEDEVSASSQSSLSAQKSLALAKEKYLAYREARTGPRTINEELADIALEVPGFGGYFYEKGSEQLSVYLKDISQKASLASVLESRVGKGFGIRSSSQANDIKVVKGEYSTLELYNWFNSLNSVFEISAVTGVDLDESRNRIWIGTADPSVEEQILDVATNAGVPKEAIVIAESRPTQPTSLVESIVLCN